MTKLGLLVALVAAARAEAQPSLPPPDAPGPSTAEAIRLVLRDRVEVTQFGATSAFAVDPTVVEVSAHDGRIAIIARNMGETTVSVITEGTIVSFPVTVVAPPPWRVVDPSTSVARKWTVWQGQYESLTARLTNSVELVDNEDHRRLRAYAVNVTRLDSASDSSDARSAMPAMALEWKTDGNEVVLLDKLVEHSPLTLDGTTLRGAHVRIGGFEAHGGVTSPLLYQNVFLSTQCEVALGASYELRLGGSRSSLVSSVYGYPSTPTTGGTRGVSSSLMYRYVSPGDHLQLRSELGWGGRLGAATELTYQEGTTRAWINARHEPRGYAALGIGRPLGTIVDAVWTAQAGRTTLTASATGARYEVGAHDQDVATSTVEYREHVFGRLSTSLGLSVGQFDDVRSLTVPVGLYIEGRAAGASAIYRYQTNSARNNGGHGGRLGAHAGSRALRVSAFVDAQQEAASVELVLRDQPLLAQLLDEMGITVTSAEDLARVLRENAILSQLGYVQGASLDFNPWRVQAGTDIAWIAQDATRQQLRLRALVDRTQTVSSKRDTRTASLQYSRRIGVSVDAIAMVSIWNRDGGTGSVGDAWSIAGGLRVRIDDVPHLRSRGGGDIDGVVVLDGSGTPVPAVTVRLDLGRAAVTDAAGRFTFARVPGGEHQVQAELPDGMYFAGPSHIDVEAGGTARFTVVRAPGRLVGFVRDDAGAGISDVTLTLRGPAGDAATSAITDSGGRFSFAVPDGNYELAVAPETVPAGYNATAIAPQEVVLRANEPQQLDLVVPANRSIAGSVHGGSEHASITILELGRDAVIDAGGRYVFRRLPPGTYTIAATVGGTTKTRVVTLGAAPAVIRDVDF